MNNMRVIVAFALCFSASIFAMPASQQLMKPYPIAEKGMKRQTIELPPQPDEALYKIELLPGQTMMTDCNQYRISGDLQKKTIEGWGYNYYVFNVKPSSSVSTQKACLDGQEKSTFVAAYLGSDAFIRYNSKLPVVIYTPGNIDVKYRVWKAGETVNSAEVQ